ncbi:hypothetical protein [Yinghuangia aomiensis]|uniref:hypothetical protein n=1 Tax=Yinghuangia aomiensis TaxID=676205 RepID=UPI0031EBBAB9
MLLGDDFRHGGLAAPLPAADPQGALQAAVRIPDFRHAHPPLHCAADALDPLTRMPSADGTGGSVPDGFHAALPGFLGLV